MRMFLNKGPQHRLILTHEPHRIHKLQKFITDSRYLKPYNQIKKLDVVDGSWIHPHSLWILRFCFFGL